MSFNSCKVDCIFSDRPILSDISRGINNKIHFCNGGYPYFNRFISLMLTSKHLGEGQD